MSSYSINEMMIVVVVCCLYNGVVCFVGIGLLLKVVNLVCLIFLLDVVLIYEFGLIGVKFSVLLLFIGDGELVEIVDIVVFIGEIFCYWLQGGWIDVGFFGVVQVDCFGNINIIVIGDYCQFKVCLLGVGGVLEIVGSVKEVLIIFKQLYCIFVDKLVFVILVGYGEGGDLCQCLGLLGKGLVVIIIDLCIMELEVGSNEFVVILLYLGVICEQVVEVIGWVICFVEWVVEMFVLSEVEFVVLCDFEVCIVVVYGQKGSDE